MTHQPEDTSIRQQISEILSKVEWRDNPDKTDWERTISKKEAHAQLLNLLHKQATLERIDELENMRLAFLAGEDFINWRTQRLETLKQSLTKEDK